MLSNAAADPSPPLLHLDPQMLLSSAWLGPGGLIGGGEGKVGSQALWDGGLKLYQPKKTTRTRWSKLAILSLVHPDLWTGPRT